MPQPRGFFTFVGVGLLPEFSVNWAYNKVSGMEFGKLNAQQSGQPLFTNAEAVLNVDPGRVDRGWVIETSISAEMGEVTPFTRILQNKELADVRFLSDVTREVYSGRAFITNIDIQGGKSARITFQGEDELVGFDIAH